MSLALSTLHSRDRVNIVEPGRLHPAVSFARASTATYMGSTGTLMTAAVNAPRYEYDSAGNYLGLLIEEARTNLNRYSNDLTNAAWNKVQLTATANAANGAIGTGSMTRVKRSNTAGGSYYCGQAVTAPINALVTLTILAKAGDLGNRIGIRLQGTYPDRADAVFDLSTGTVVGSAAVSFAVVSATMRALGNGEYACSLTATVQNTVLSQSIFGPAANSGGSIGSWEVATPILYDVLVDSIQTETGAFATSYIPTTSAGVTRSADIVQINTPVTAIGYSGTLGTMYAEWNGGLESTQSAYGRVVSNAATATLLSTSGRTIVSSWDGGLASNRVLGVDIPTVMVKTAGAYSTANNIKNVTGNGLLPPGTSVFTNFDSPTALAIGKNQNAATNMLNGHIRRLTWYNRFLSNTELQRLTA